MRALSLLLLLLSTTVFGQDNLGPVSGGLTRGNYLRIPDYKTTSAQSWFVDASTGNDSFDCRSASTPCLTIQGALNKIPKLLQYGVTVTVAAGTYGGFAIAGFTCDPGVQITTGGISVDGFAALTNSTLATGSATGTAAGGGQSAGSGTTYGTLCDSGATWTVNDLKGRFITTASPTNTAVVISSNTATCVTVVGTWSLPVAGSTTYTIQDPGVIINTSINSPASPTSVASAGAGILINNNRCGARNTSMLIRGMRLTNSGGGGIYYNDLSAANFVNLQIRNTSGGTAGFQSGGPSAGIPGVVTGQYFLTNIDMLGNGSGTNYTWGVMSGSPLGTNVLIRGGGVGLQVGKGANVTAVSGTGVPRPSVTALDVQASTSPPVVVASGAVTLIGAHLDCSAGAGTALTVGGTTATTDSPYAFAEITSGLVSTCGTGVIVNGTLSSAELTALTGSAATTGISVLSGGSVTFSRASTTMTGGTNDISIDSGGVTAALGDVAAATCLMGAQTTSQVCGR